MMTFACPRELAYSAFNSMWIDDQHNFYVLFIQNDAFIHQYSLIHSSAAVEHEL